MSRSRAKQVVMRHIHLASDESAMDEKQVEKYRKENEFELVIMDNTIPDIMFSFYHQPEHFEKHKELYGQNGHGCHTVSKTGRTVTRVSDCGEHNSFRMERRFFSQEIPRGLAVKWRFRIDKIKNAGQIKISLLSSHNCIYNNFESHKLMVFNGDEEMKEGFEFIVAVLFQGTKPYYGSAHIMKPPEHKGNPLGYDKAWYFKSQFKMHPYRLYDLVITLKNVGDSIYLVDYHSSH